MRVREDQGPLGIIGGGAFLEATPIAGATLREVPTPFGPVALHVGSGFVFLRRHGEDTYRPPHRIPHHAHVLALEALGVRQVASFASSGALRAELRPGDLVVPDDYLSWRDPPTFAADEYLHVVPSLDEHVRDLLIRAAERALEAIHLGATHLGATHLGATHLGVTHPGEAAPPAAPSFAAGPDTPPEATRAPARDSHEPTLHRSGVYVETLGPRFETRAEVRMLAAHATVVGMTAASEATLCQERGIGYAMLCTVDNWANGVGAEALTLDRFQAQLAKSGVLAREIVQALIDLWREG